MLTSDAARALLVEGFRSFPAFCGLIDIVPKEGKRQKLVLNEIQRRYCRARTPRDIVLKPRQVGMTTLEQARDLWHFFSRPGARVTVMCQSQDDDAPRKKLIRDFNIMFESLGALGLELPRPSATGLWALPKRDAVLQVSVAGASERSAQKKGRAGTITRFHATEIAFWDHASDTLNAVEECVVSAAHGGEIIKESTPNGYGGKFYDDVMAARDGRSGFTLHFFPWFYEKGYKLPLAQDEHFEPANDRERALSALGVTAEQLKWRRQKIADKGSESLVDQEYPSDPDTCFLKGGRMFFVQDACIRHQAACKPPRRVDWREALRIWHEPEPHEEYVIGCDTSEGIEEPGKPLAEQPHDASAAIVRKRRTGEHVATLWAMLRPNELADKLVPLACLYNGALIAVERNNHGHATLLWLVQHHRYPNVFFDLDGRAGWLNTAPKRTSALDVLEREHRKGPPHYSTPDAALVKQQLSFIVDPHGVARAAQGAHDDLVIADAIAWDVLCRPVIRRDTRHLPPA
jgi:hypothetical protein